MLGFTLYGTNVPHEYYVYADGVDCKPAYFLTRKEAEIYMNNYASSHSIQLECTECDKHERKYSNHKGDRFYINRI